MYEILPGEKFAFVAFTYFDAPINDRAPTDLGGGCFMSHELPFDLKGVPRRLIGELIADQFGNTTLPKVVLLAKTPSTAPGKLDNENEILSERIDNLLVGIAIVAGIPMY
jgi:hypothetical protein